MQISTDQKSSVCYCHGKYKPTQIIENGQYGVVLTVAN